MDGFLIGNSLLIGCCSVYLIWWSITFNPFKRFAYGPKVVLFFITLALGLGGIVTTIVSMSGLDVRVPIAPTWLVALGGLGLYILLVFLSPRLFRRQITTELLLIVGWLTLETCGLNTLYGAGLISNLHFWICLGCALGASVIAMICYLVYYALEKRIAFFVGMAPLVVFALAMVVFLVLG